MFRVIQQCVFRHLVVSFFSSIAFLASSVALGQAAEPSIKFGVLSIAQPVRIHAKWQPFVDYVSEQLGRPVEIVVPRGFGNMRTAAVQGDVDFFYVNSYVFYRLKQSGHAMGVAQMQNIDGNVTSRSEIYVRSDSGITQPQQLRGKSIAFVSPMGAGGYLAPRAYLYSLGVRTKEETEEVFTKNLSNSIHGVLLGDVTAGTMCGVNYRLMSQKVNTGELKIIGVSAEYPENVIAARSELDRRTVDRFTTAVLSLETTPEGRAVLEQMRSMKVKRFLAYDAEVEQITRRLLAEADLETK